MLFNQYLLGQRSLFYTHIYQLFMEQHPFGKCCILVTQPEPEQT